MNAYMDWEYEILNDYQNKVLLDAIIPMLNMII